MRYDIWKIAIEQICDQEEQERPAAGIEAARRRVRDIGMRMYHLGGGNLLRLYCEHNRPPVIYLTRERFDIDDRSSPTAETFDRAASAVRHVNAWIAGEVDELAPSGPWPA